MYRDWYAAYVNQMSAEDTASFLSMIDVLKNPHTDISLKKYSLEEAKEHLDFNLQIYILPYLVGIAVNEERTLRREARKLICQIAENSQSILAMETARNIDKPDNVQRQIQSLIQRPHDSSSETFALEEDNYITLSESIDSIMCLSALINYSKSEIQSIVKEERCAEFLKMSVKGAFGRYVMVLAYDVCLLSDLEDFIKDAWPKLKQIVRFYEFPDIVEIYQKIKFYDYSAEQILDKAFDSKLLFNRFLSREKIKIHRENDSFWLSSGLPFDRKKNQYEKQLRILWENIAVYLAVLEAVNSQNLAEILCRIAWFWEGQRDNVAADDSQAARCPWMFRTNEVYTKAKSEPFAEYPTMGSQAVTLKAGLAAPILSLAFHYGLHKLPEFFYELVMNHADAYSGAGISQYVENGFLVVKYKRQETHFSDSVISLLAYAKKTISYIGKGYFNGNVPEQLFLITEKNSKCVLNGMGDLFPEQRKYLHCGASVMVCAAYAYEEASADFPEVRKGDYWLRGGDASFAAKICEIALNDFWEYVRNSESYSQFPENHITTPIDLAYEHFPMIIQNAGISVADWLHNDKRPNTQTMLLCSYRADEWDGRKKKIELKNYPVRSKEFSVALTALTHQLYAILGRTDNLTPSDKKVIDDWLNALVKMDSPKYFSRSLRFFLTRMLEKLLKDNTIQKLSFGEDDTEKDSETEENETEEKEAEKKKIKKDATDMIQIIVEAIADLSKQAPFYQYAVAKAVVNGKLGSGFVTTDKLIKSALFYVLLSQEKYKSDNRTVLADPYLLEEQNGSKEIRRQIIFWYISNIKNNLTDKGSEIRINFLQMLEKWYERDGYKKKKIAVRKESIKVKGKNANYINICNGESSDEEWYQWEPDVLKVRGMSEDELEKYQEAFVKSSGGKYTLLERGFLEFLIEKGFCKHENFVIVLQDENKEGYLFSAGMGLNYRIPFEFLTQKSLEMLQEKIYEYKEKKEEYPRGLYIDGRVKTDERQRMPFLEITDLREDNLNYIKLFSDSESVMVKENSGKFQVEKDGFWIDTGVTETAGMMSVANEGWSALGQRCGKLNVIPVVHRQLRINGRDDDVLKQIKRICSFCREDERHIVKVRIDPTYKRNIKMDGILYGETIEGIPVKIQADSLMLGQTKYIPTGYEDYMIESVPALKYGINCNGIIWGISQNIAEADKLITIKYVEDDVVYESCVKAEELKKDIDINYLYIGMPIFYDKAAEEMVPVFYCPKNILLRAGRYTVRYLWKMSIKPEDFMENSEGFDLGVLCLEGEEEPLHLIQDFKKGELYACRKDNIDLEQLQAELDEAASRVNVVRCFDNRVDIRYLKEAVEELAFEFQASDTLAQGKRIARQCYKKYMEWQNDRFYINNGSCYAEGIIIQENDRQYFEVRKPLMYLPVNSSNISDEVPEAWTRQVKLYDRGIHFTDSSRWALARITESEDGSFGADVDNVEPFDWVWFQKWLHKEFPNKRRYDFPLYYMDMKNGNLLFEWGIGKRFFIPKNNFAVQGKTRDGFISQLFYGDKIGCFRVRGEGKKAMLIVLIEDYDFSIEHRIKEDAENGILQYAKVCFDKEKDKITAEKVTVSKNRVENENDAWSLEKIKAGNLNEDIKQKVRKELPNGGRGYILVQLDKEKSRKQLNFKLADLNNLKKFILCMKGGEICAASGINGKGGNDYYVPFSTQFPDEKMIGDDSEFSVKVYRRSFSYNESTLRVYYGRDRSAFQNFMFVEMHKVRGEFQGDIKNLPCRPDSVIRDWLNTFGEQDVIVGKKFKSKNLLRVEIKPGVFGRAEFHHEIKEGVTGRISLKGESIVVEPVSWSDDYFLTEGRTVELLMLDSAFRENPRDEQFTVAGMPQIKLGNAAMAEQLKEKYPPRYGKFSGNSLINAGNVPFGYLKAENNDGSEKIMFYRYTNKKKDFFHFHAITFFDASTSEIRRHIQRGQWHYHDRVTLVKMRDNGKYRSVEYKENCDLPIVFDGRWSLRYKADELEKYVFPPHELEEFGLPEEQYGLDYRYPIAGNAEDGILVEISPGRIVKISERLLYILDSNKKNGKLCTKYISEGDVVKLSIQELEPGKPMHIQLLGIEYGMRSLIKDKAFLPFIKEEGGCVVLGGGFYRIKYPKGNIPKTEICILDRNNNLSRYKEESPKSGDLVFLTLNQEMEMKVAGFDSLSVHICEGGDGQGTGNGTWVHKALSNTIIRKKMFDIMDNMIPVLVDKTVENQVFVYYPQPSWPEEKSVLCCEVIGVLFGSIVCIRSGDLLFQVDINEIIKIPDKNLAEEITKCLKPKEQIWMHFDGSKFHMGCYRRMDTKIKRKIKVKRVIDSKAGSGFVCEDILSYELYWMPVKNASRGNEASARMVYDIFFPKKKDNQFLSVEIDEHGYASCLKNNASLQVPFDSLHAGDRNKKIKVVVDFKVRNHLYVCHERPKGNIYMLKTEIERRVKDKVDAYCIEKDENTAVLMPCGEIRTPIYLSFQVLKSVRLSYGALEDGGQSKEILRDKLEKILIKNRENNKELGDELRCFAEELFRLQETCGNTDSSLQECRAKIPEIIGRYLERIGEEKDSKVNSNLANLLLILAVAFSSDDAAWKLKAENIYERIRQNIAYYACEEILLKEWFLVSYYGTTDLRTLLSSAYFGGIELKEDGSDGNATDQKDGELTVNQVEKIINVCETVLRRYRDDESGVHAELALCLLKVSGQIEKYTQYENDLKSIIEKTKCYRKISEEKLNETNAADIARFVLELPKDDDFLAIGVHEACDIYDILLEKRG